MRQLLHAKRQKVRQRMLAGDRRFGGDPRNESKRAVMCSVQVGPLPADERVKAGFVASLDGRSRPMLFRVSRVRQTALIISIL